MLVRNKLIDVLLLTIALAVSQAVVAIEPVPRIVGGTIASNHAYPFMAAIEYDSDNFQFCGGTLIAPTKVLTAGHCLVTTEAIHVRIGTNNKNINPGQIISVVKKVRHSKYNASTLDYDVAVFTLATPVQLSDSKNLIKLPEACTGLMCITGLAKPDTLVRTAGWGSTVNDGSNASFDLREVDIPLISNETCKGVFGNNITSRMICAGFDLGGKGSCYGDSGGPLFGYYADARAGLQTGIVSWGVKSCAQAHTYGVYTRISNPEIRKFIYYHSGI